MAAAKYQFFLSSKLGRRTLFLFIVCALLPIVLLSIQSRRQIDSLYQQQQQNELRQAAKGLGLLLFERIQYIERQASEIVNNIQSLNEIEAANYLQTQEYLIIEQIDFVSFEEAALLGVPLNSTEKQHLQNPNQPLLAFVDETPLVKLVLLYPVMNQGHNKLASFTISQTYLWDFLQEYDLSKSFQVFDNVNRLVFNSESLQPYQLEQQRPSSFWHLFLNDRYGAGSWRIEAITNDSTALEDRDDFQQLTLMTTLLAIFLASLVSVYAIRRSTAPIEALSKGIEHLNKNNFSHQVEIKSNDEFEDLGNTFNTMAAKLGQHISAIRSLSAIDQIILNQLKIEDIIEVVLTEGSKLLQAENIYFLIRNEVSLDFSFFSSNGKIKKDIELTTSELTALHRPTLITTTRELSVLTEIIIEKNQDACFYSSVLGPLDDCKAVLIAEFIQTPNDDLLNLATLFVDHVTVALTNADWEGKLFQQSHYDTLTGLPNRYFFNDQLINSIEQASNSDQNMSLFYIGIDDFKVINDSLGHTVGDKVLEQVAHNLSSIIDGRGKLARLGGDEFVLIYFSDEKNRSHLVNKAGKLAEDLRVSGKKLITIDDKEVKATISIGISLYPFDCESSEELLQFAGEAMYIAKNEGKNAFNFYSDIANSSTINRVQFIAELRKALAEDQFELYYQPKVNLKTARIDGCEALIRWNHPDKGLLSPFFFIPQAEEFGMIGEIGLWVVRDAARQQKAWLDRGFDFGQIAVNVSVLQLKEIDFHQDFLDILQETGCPAEALEIEITETAYVGDMENFRGHLDSLADIGVTFSVDDYGTGYSSLSLLLNLPIKTLKIDKSFIDDIETSPLSYAIVESTILLANAVGLKIVAEGVEEYGQLAILKEFDCSNVQGYYFSKPVTVGKLETMNSENYFFDALFLNTEEASS